MPQNGTLTRPSPILGADGNPFAMEVRNPRSPAYGGGPGARDAGSFALPHVITYSSVMSSANKVYSWRWDEAYKNSRDDALSMRRDAFLMGIMQERRLASSQLNWHLEPEDAKDKRQQEAANYLTKIIERTRGLPKMLWNLSDATWYGRYGTQHAFAWQTMGGRPKGLPGPSKAYVSTGHRPLNGDKIQYTYRLNEDKGAPEVQDGTPVILVHSAYVQGLGERAKTVITDRGRGLLLDQPFWRERFVIHTHEPDDADFFEAEMAGGVFGVGIRSRIYWLDWIRKEWLSNISDYIQRVGMGVVIFYYEAGNPQSEAEAITAANNMADTSVIVWPRPIGSEKQGAGIERFDMPLTGSETLIKLSEHIEAIIERYIIGQSASSKSDAQGMGTHDNSAQQATKFAIVRFDAMNLADTLTHDFVRPLQRWNLPEEPYQLRWVFDIDKPDAKDALEAANKAFSMGATLKESEILSFAGLSKPEKDDAVLKQQQPPQGGPGGLPPGGMPPPGGPGGAPGGAPPAPSGAGLAAPMQPGGAPDPTTAAALADMTAPMQFAKRGRPKMIDWKGLKLGIENPKGSTRSGMDRDGKRWSVKLQHDYGFIDIPRRTRDGEELDFFMGPNPQSELVFVIDQVDPRSDCFDEHKIVLGAVSLDEAEDVYLSNYEDGWDGLGAITPMSMPEFQHWLRTGELLASVAYAAEDWVKEKAGPRSKKGWRWRNSKTGKVSYKPPGKGRTKKEEGNPAEKPPAEAAKPEAKTDDAKQPAPTKALDDFMAAAVKTGAITMDDVKRGGQIPLQKKYYPGLEEQLPALVEAGLVNVETYKDRGQDPTPAARELNLSYKGEPIASLRLNEDPGGTARTAGGVAAKPDEAAEQDQVKDVVKAADAAKPLDTKTDIFRANPPQVAQPTVLESKVAFKDPEGNALIGKGIAIPGLEQFKLVAVPPRGSKANHDKRGWEIFEQTTGLAIAKDHDNPLGGSLQGAAEYARRVIEKNGGAGRMETLIRQALAKNKPAEEAPQAVSEGGKPAESTNHLKQQVDAISARLSKGEQVDTGDIYGLAGQIGAMPPADAIALAKELGFDRDARGQLIKTRSGAVRAIVDRLADRVENLERGKAATQKLEPAEAMPQAGAAQPGSSLARGWLAETGPRQERVFAAMRDIDNMAQAALEKSRKLRPPQGTVGIGGADFDEELKGQTLQSYVSNLNKGKTPEEALAAAQADAKAMIQKWNTQGVKGRAGVSSKEEMRRWEGAMDSTLQDAHRRVLRSAEEQHGENWNRKQAVSDLRGLASGTLASLTGISNIDQLDQVRNAMHEFVQGRPDADYETWQDAWNDFKQSVGGDKKRPESFLGQPKAAPEPPFQRTTPSKAERESIKAQAEQLDEEVGKLDQEIAVLNKKIRSNYDPKRDEKLEQQKAKLIAKKEKAMATRDPLNKQLAKGHLEDLIESGDEAQKISARAKMVSDATGPQSRETTQALRDSFNKIKELGKAEAIKQGATPEEAELIAGGAASMISSYPSFNTLERQVASEMGRQKRLTARNKAWDDIDALKDLTPQDKELHRRHIENADPKDMKEIIDKATKENNRQRLEREFTANMEREASQARKTFSGDVASVKVNPLQDASVIAQITKTPRASKMLGLAQQAGIATDGHWMFKIPEKDQAKYRRAGNGEDPGGFRKTVEDLMAKADVEQQPAKISGVRASDDPKKDPHIYLVESPTGRKVGVNAQYLETIRKRYPNATIHLSQARRAQDAGGKPIIFKDGGQVVGAVMALDGYHEATVSGAKSAQPTSLSNAQPESGRPLDPPVNFAAMSRTFPKEARPSLTEAEAKAVRQYTGGGHRPVNDALWAGGSLDEHAQSIDDGLQAALAKVPQFKEPVTVRRGVNLGKSVLEKFRNAKPGETVSFPGWTSTTNKSGTFPGNVEFRIAATHGLDVKGSGDEDTQKERELLLPRGAKFKVHAVKQSGKRLVVHLEQVPEPVQHARGDQARHFEKGQPCKPGERADRTGCIPKKGGADKARTASGQAKTQEKTQSGQGGLSARTDRKLAKPLPMPGADKATAPRETGATPQANPWSKATDQVLNSGKVTPSAMAQAQLIRNRQDNGLDVTPEQLAFADAVEQVEMELKPKRKLAEPMKPPAKAASPTTHDEPAGDAHWGSKAQPYWRPGANPTVDNVITRDNPQTGEREVLMIQRGPNGAEAGKWALPGGFHDTASKKGEAWKPGKETAEQAALRELAEETGLDGSSLAGTMKPVGEYEGGGRDPRDNKEAWSRSSAFSVHLTPEQAAAMSNVQGMDDASAAKWVPVSKLGEHQLAFDHAKILADAGVKARDGAGKKPKPEKPKAKPQKPRREPAPGKPNKPGTPSVADLESMVGSQKERARSVARSVLAAGSLQAALDFFDAPDTHESDKLGRMMAQAVYGDPDSESAAWFNALASPRSYQAEDEDEVS